MSLSTWLAPWEFSPTTIVVVVAVALLYLRGSWKRSPGFWRQLSFWLGLVVVYVMLQTYVDYYAEREFFIHRLQHLGLHHIGPFLIILASPGQTLRAGLPMRWRAHLWDPLFRSAPVRFVFDVLLNPVVASCLFFGVVLFWLWPPVHFVAMIDWRWYRVMNWSVTVDGLLFWWLVLDHRPRPPARMAPGWRVLAPLLVALPQIFAGAFLVFDKHQAYPIYELCGQAIAGITAMQSQMLGGIVTWIPSAMMMGLAALLAFRHWLNLSSHGRAGPRRRPPPVPVAPAPAPSGHAEPLPDVELAPPVSVECVE